MSNSVRDARPAPWSLVLSVAISFLAIFLTYQSPLALILLAAYVLSLLSGQRFERDSGNLWGLRLLVYAAVGALGRSAVAAPDYLFDARSFATAGLISGSELVLQAWRRPPPHLRFEPLIVLLTGVMFLVAANTNGVHIWVLAPLYIGFTLLALIDLRPRSQGFAASAFSRRALLLAAAVAGGTGAHQELLAHRYALMALGARLLSGGRLAGPTAAGLSDSSMLGDGPFTAGQSPLRMLRIDGALDDPHLREASFTTYHDGQWGGSISHRHLVAALDAETRATERGPYTQVTLLHDTGHLLFFPLNAAALVPPLGSSFNWIKHAGPISTDDDLPYSYFFLNPYPSSARITAKPFQGPLCYPPSPAARDLLLQVPSEIEPGVIALAHRIAPATLSPAARVDAITGFLLGHYQYSLSFHRSHRDPVSDFLLNHKSAHCQYFASAATIMLRASGIPACYVIGYYAHENDGPYSTLVRQRDAHAWCEAFVPGTGWEVVEATPPMGRADPAVSPLPWYQKLLERAQDWFETARYFVAHLTPLQMGEIVLVIALLWGAERWRLRRRDARATPHGPLPPPGLVPVARRFERALAKRSTHLSPNQPWSEIVPPDWPQGQDFLRSYNRVRFAPQEPNLEESLRRLDKLVELAEATTQVDAPGQHQRDARTPTRNSQ